MHVLDEGVNLLHFAAQFAQRRGVMNTTIGDGCTAILVVVSPRCAAKTLMNIRPKCGLEADDDDRADCAFVHPAAGLAKIFAVMKVLGDCNDQRRVTQFGDQRGGLRPTRSQRFFADNVFACSHRRPNRFSIEVNWQRNEDGFDGGVVEKRVPIVRKVRFATNQRGNFLRGNRINITDGDSLEL